jgi:hypothetical protein
MWATKDPYYDSYYTMGAKSIDACFKKNTPSAWTELPHLKSKQRAVFSKNTLHTSRHSAIPTVPQWYHGTSTAYISKFYKTIHFWRTCSFQTITQKKISTKKKSKAHTHRCNTRNFASPNETPLSREHSEPFKSNQKMKFLLNFG